MCLVLHTVTLGIRPLKPIYTKLHYYYFSLILSGVVRDGWRLHYAELLAGGKP